MTAKSLREIFLLAIAAAKDAGYEKVCVTGIQEEEESPKGKVKEPIYRVSLTAWPVGGGSTCDLTMDLAEDDGELLDFQSE